MKPQHLLFAALAGVATLSSCKKEITSKEEIQDNLVMSSSKNKMANPELKLNTFYGPQVQIGNGKARSFLVLSHTGVPQELGIELTDGALSGLPEDGEHAAFVLPLHQKTNATTPFDHIVINWNPHGHPPFELFGEPHFDFHFYTISIGEQMAIPEYTPGSPHDILPEAAYWPAGFVPLPGGEAQMGKHWADVVHPVLPGTFTHTMIYGSYKGAMIFVEPMITRAFLESGTNVSMPYGQPSQFQKTGTYYPTSYNVTSDETGKHIISLSNFALR